MSLAKTNKAPDRPQGKKCRQYSLSPKGSLAPRNSSDSQRHTSNSHDNTSLCTVGVCPTASLLDTPNEPPLTAPALLPSPSYIPTPTPTPTLTSTLTSPSKPLATFLITQPSELSELSELLDQAGRHAGLTGPSKPRPNTPDELVILRALFVKENDDRLQAQEHATVLFTALKQLRRQCQETENRCKILENRCRELEKRCQLLQAIQRPTPQRNDTHGSSRDMWRRLD